MPFSSRILKLLTFCHLNKHARSYRPAKSGILVTFTAKKCCVIRNLPIYTGWTKKNVRLLQNVVFICWLIPLLIVKVGPPCTTTAGLVLSTCTGTTTTAGLVSSTCTGTTSSLVLVLVLVT